MWARGQRCDALQLFSLLRKESLRSVLSEARMSEGSMGSPFANPGWLMTLDFVVGAFLLAAVVFALIEDRRHAKELKAWRDSLGVEE
jgi:hypothetical protein